MTHSKHTPGAYDQPLTCRQHGFDSAPLQSPDGIVYVTQISNQTYHIGKIIQYGKRDWNEAAATAQVMLAAPELLNELYCTLANHHTDGAYGGGDCGLSPARAARIAAVLIKAGHDGAILDQYRKMMTDDTKAEGGAE